MIVKCANPNCTAPYEQRTGRLFYLRHPKSNAPANAHSVHHFWLCKSCSTSFKLEYREGRAALIALQTAPKENYGAATFEGPAVHLVSEKIMMTRGQWRETWSRS
jgi:hypothetical protein